MAEEITVEAPVARVAKRPGPNGLSPLQAGILYGGAGAALGGPIGLLAGLFAGVVSKNMRDNYLDRVARDTQNDRAEYAGLRDEINSELAIADPDEKRLLSSAKRLAADGWYRLESGDETGRQMIAQANETIRGIMNSDIQNRKAEQAAQFNFQRGLISNSASSYREQFSSTITQAQQIDSISQRVLELTADSGFDPNKPFNRAVLADLISTGVGGMFRDDPNGFLAGVAEGGAGTIVGAIAKGTKTWLDDDEFKITREDYNRIALNARKVTRLYANQRLGELRQQSDSLNQFARQVGAIPEDYNLADYVSGGVRDLQLAPEAKVPVPRDVKQPARTQQWRQPPALPQRTRPQVPEQEQVPFMSDAWFRQRLGVPTTRNRRPTN
jgi:hypothetical protein